MKRELFWRENATCVLPYDPVRDEVVLIEQFRAGALGRKASPGCWKWWRASMSRATPPRLPRPVRRRRKLGLS